MESYCRPNHASFLRHRGAKRGPGWTEVARCNPRGQRWTSHRQRAVRRTGLGSCLHSILADACSSSRFLSCFNLTNNPSPAVRSSSLFWCPNCLRRFYWLLCFRCSFSLLALAFGTVAAAFSAVHNALPSRLQRERQCALPFPTRAFAGPSPSATVVACILRLRSLLFAPSSAAVRFWESQGTVR